MKQFTLADIARHNKDNDNYIVIDDKVYDVTSFSRFHPVCPNVTSSKISSLEHYIQLVERPV